MSKDTGYRLIQPDDKELTKNPYQPKKQKRDQSQPSPKHIQCDQCGFWLLPASLANHINLHSKMQKFVCPFCLQIFYSQGSIKKHVQKNHVRRDIECDSCESTFHCTIEDFRLHSNTFHDGRECGRARRPVKRTEKNEQQVEVKEEERVDSDNRPESPEHLEPQVTVDRLEMPEIQKTPKKVAEIGPFICNLCTREFDTSEKLHRHKGNRQCIGRQRALQDESESFYYECPQRDCPKIFKRYGYLRDHLKFHDEKKFLCAHCPSVFTARSSFQSHFFKKHSRDPQQCKYCPAVPLGVVALREHVRVRHPPIGTKAVRLVQYEKGGLVCGYCPSEMRFETFEALASHLDRVHHREFPCRHCSRAYSDVSHLKTHEAAHHDEKSVFICDLCAKVTHTRLAFRIHWLKHSDEKKFMCPHCGAQMKRLWALTRHIKQFHFVK